jgi:hypothetical protein
MKYSSRSSKKEPFHGSVVLGFGGQEKILSAL